jgi:hypothetical protein
MHLCTEIRYYVDRCTKNKCMIRITTHVLFLTCTESPFLLIKHTQHKK